MNETPTLTTDRLHLRPFDLSDATRVKDLAGEWEIATTTANIPHPYEEGMAEEWIGTHRDRFEKEDGVAFAITLRDDGALIGAIGFHVNKAHKSAEIGYWIGVPYWNQGYATEAARAVVEYAFDEWDLNRIQARHMTKNPASGRVMQKIGMRYEGKLRGSLYRWGSFEDAELYAILRQDFEADGEERSYAYGA